ALSREPPQRGTAADLALACTRTAMQAAARGLAAWLAELDARKSAQELPVARERNTASVSAPPVAGIATPPIRPSTRSITESLGMGVPHAGLGEGTPGFVHDDAAGTSTRAATTPDPPRATTTSPAYQRFGDRDPTASVSATAPKFVGDATATSPAPRF